MKPFAVKPNKRFIDRHSELEKLAKISESNEASIIVMYGRRRVGKTELLEQAFQNRNLLKFEGIEGLSEEAQLANAMSQLANYVEDRLLAKVKIETWREFFEILTKYTAQGTWTIYLEELQWLADYKSILISELKYVWDNYFRHNPNLIIILCGSAPSFMLDQVVHSRALYNRSQYEIHLREFTIAETARFLKGRSQKEIFDAYLTVGGIPEYLKWVNRESSVFLSLCQHSFTSGSFFAREYEKIFTSSMAKNKHYKKIIVLLSKRKFSTRNDIAKALKINSGGSLSDILLDLEKSGFITKYYPYNLNEDTMLTRYAIADNYLQYHDKFIKPIENRIANGDYDRHPTSALKTDSYIKWLGYSFERFCRKYHYQIAKILGFSAIQYQSGVFFNRATDEENPGYQIDLIFDRADHVYTICEIKYITGKVGTKVIQEFETKLSRFPNKANKTIHKVLICNEGAEQTLIDKAYFDEIITCDLLLEL